VTETLLQRRLVAANPQPLGSGQPFKPDALARKEHGRQVSRFFQNERHIDQLVVQPPVYDQSVQFLSKLYQPLRPVMQAFQLSAQVAAVCILRRLLQAAGQV